MQPPTVGVLALQGAFAAHVERLRAIGATAVEVRTPEQLRQVDALVMPGGESTTMSNLLGSTELFDPIAARLGEGMPVFGTCAGMILLADKILDGRDDQRHFGTLDVTVRRNGYGRQINSFETDLDLDRRRPAVPRRVHPRPAGRGGRSRRRGAGVVRRRSGARSPRTISSPPAFIQNSPSTHDSTPGSWTSSRKVDRCPAIPSGQRSSTRRAPPTRLAASCSPSSPASWRCRRGREAAIPTPTRRCAPPCRRRRRRR